MEKLTQGEIVKSENGIDDIIALSDNFETCDFCGFDISSEKIINQIYQGKIIATICLRCYKGEP